MVEIVRTIAELRTRVAGWRREGLKVALVPTMGALHDGHISLVRLGLDQADRCVMSIFVNPTQFAPNEDFAAYPRREADDVAAFASAGGHLAFIPAVEEMYREGFSTHISLKGPAIGLEQDFRPTHFDGVALVVTKLLLAALADVAVFGEKDYQQLQVIKRLVADLDIPTAIIAAPTVRDAQGLALSSRNAYLSAEQLEIARQLNRLMDQLARQLTAAPEAHGGLLEQGRAALIDRGFDRVDYLEARAVDLKPWQPGGPGRLLAAVWLGRARLIDNLPIPGR